MGFNTKKNKMGWIPDYPDFRDYTVDHPTIEPLLKKAKISGSLTAALPASVDLRQWCPPIEDQGQIGSCTANAGVGLVEYFERKAYGTHIDASRLFLYKTTRNLLHMQGDTGAYLRSTMQALILFGVPPEEFWPYTDQTGKNSTTGFDVEPTAFCYAFAQNYQTLKYYRYDPPGTAAATLLTRIKTHLAAQMPSMFGFTVYSSITQADTSGKIPFPKKNERVEGGHAIVAVGYDDAMKIKNTGTGGIETTGAFLIRNSWGTEWGDKGYGWLPYEYVLKGLAEDWWSIVKMEWIDTNAFNLP